MADPSKPSEPQADPKAGLMDEARDWVREASQNVWFRNGLIIAFVIAALDQLSKYWIVHVIDLPARRQIDLSSVMDFTYVQNFGASFGMLAGGMGSRILLLTISTGVALGLTVWLGRLHRPIAATGIAFIIGGAVGNLIDRALLGYVVDFIDFSGLWFPWVFNVADTAINVGVGLLLLDAWRTRDEA